jgi:hypothetical protein
MGTGETNAARLGESAGKRTPTATGSAAARRSSRELGSNLHRRTGIHLQWSKDEEQRWVRGSVERISWDDDAEQWRAQGSEAGKGKQQGARGTSSSPFIGQEAVAIDDHGDYGRFWKKSEGRCIDCSD